MDDLLCQPTMRSQRQTRTSVFRRVGVEEGLAKGTFSLSDAWQHAGALALWHGWSWKARSTGVSLSLRPAAERRWSLRRVILLQSRSTWSKNAAHLFSTIAAIVLHSSLARPRMCTLNTNPALDDLLEDPLVLLPLSQFVHPNQLHCCPGCSR